MTTTPTAPTAATPTAPARPRPVQTPLTLVMTLKSPEAYQDLKATLEQFASMPDAQNPIIQAMDAVGTVHFARFVFLDTTRLMVVTTFDGDLNTYLEDFAAKIGNVFDLLNAHMVDAPPAPVKEHPAEFLAYVQANNLATLGWYSAYPTKTVLDIVNEG